MKSTLSPSEDREATLTAEPAARDPLPAYFDSHPKLACFLTSSAFETVLAKSIEVHKTLAPDEDPVAAALDERFSDNREQSFVDLLASLKIGGVNEDVLEGFEAQVEMAEQLTGFGGGMACCKSAREWVERWEHCK